MFQSNLLKKQHLEIFTIYQALFSKPLFTVGELNTLFKNDADIKEWKDGQQTDLATAFHAFLSDQFVGDSKNLASDATCTFLTRQKNKENVWVYQIDLTASAEMNTILEKVKTFLKRLDLTTEVSEADGEVGERCINGQPDVLLDQEKIFNLWFWYEEVTGELFEDAIVYV